MTIERKSKRSRRVVLTSLTAVGAATALGGCSGWGDASPSSSMADHPLLRGLLLELPARGTIPNSDWLDRWFEAARSILELLYVQEARRAK